MRNGVRVRRTVRRTTVAAATLGLPCRYTGTDTGEAVEVQAEAGTDLTGWGVVLYFGSDRAGLRPWRPAQEGSRGGPALGR